MPFNPNLQCSLCFASFRRVEHLQRHLTIHTEGRPYSCNFCGNAFKRSDVLRRHWRTCRIRREKDLSIPTVLSAPRGKKRQACDTCARLKRGCSSGLPCEACAAKGQYCSYSYLSEQPEINAPYQIQNPRGMDLGLGLAAITSYSSPSSYASERASGDYSASESDDRDSSEYVPLAARGLSVDRLDKLDFIDRSPVSGFAKWFECGNLAQRKQIASGIKREESPPLTYAITDDANANLMFENPYDLPFLASMYPEHDDLIAMLYNNPNGFGSPNINCFSESLPEQINSITPQIETGVPLWADWSLDPLAILSSDIVSRYQGVISHRSKDSPIEMDWSVSTEERCIQFFSPTNIRRFLDLFWYFWYPNCPFIHKPTFDMERVTPTLLIPMLVIGACLSPEEGHREDARCWFNSTEEIVFTDEFLLRGAVTGSVPGDNESRVEVTRWLQAAYFVCLYQNWEGTDASKQRIRRHRYSFLVSAARDLDLSTATHRDLDLTNFNWHQFIMTEQLIRTALYVFLLDTAFTIFNNLPPRMTITELKMDMACPEPLFQAQCAEECLSLIHNDLEYKSRLKNRLSVATAAQLICQKTFTADDKRTLSRMGRLNLFVLVHTLHILIFHFKTSLSFGATWIPIKTGLKNWRQVWDEQRLQEEEAGANYGLLTDNTWKRIGFMRHGREWWVLANIKFESVQKE